MKYSDIIIATLCVLGVVAFKAIRQRFSSNYQSGSFRNWLTNTEYRKATHEYFSARNAVTVPDDISQVEITRMVEQLFQKTDHDFNIEKLRLVGS